MGSVHCLMSRVNRYQNSYFTGTKRVTSYLKAMLEIKRDWNEFCFKLFKFFMACWKRVRWLLFYPKHYRNCTIYEIGKYLLKKKWNLINRWRYPFLNIWWCYLMDNMDNHFTTDVTIQIRKFYVNRIFITLHYCEFEFELVTSVGL